MPPIADDLCAGHGVVLQLHAGDNPPRAAMDAFNLPHSVVATHTTLPVDAVFDDPATMTATQVTHPVDPVCSDPATLTFTQVTQPVDPVCTDPATLTTTQVTQPVDAVCTDPATQAAPATGVAPTVTPMPTVVDPMSLSSSSMACHETTTSGHVYADDCSPRPDSSLVTETATASGHATTPCDAVSTLECAERAARVQRALARRQQQEADAATLHAGGYDAFVIRWALLPVPCLTPTRILFT